MKDFQTAAKPAFSMVGEREHLLVKLIFINRVTKATTLQLTKRLGGKTVTRVFWFLKPELLPNLMQSRLIPLAKLMLACSPANLADSADWQFLKS